LWNERNPGWTRPTASAIAEASTIASFVLVAAPSGFAAGGAIAAQALGHPTLAVQGWYFRK
jgi:hypothetical protein